MYTKEQKKIILYTREKVRELFKNYPVPAHSFDHVARVAGWAVKIAKAEKANIFLCEMAGLLHDVGRTLKMEHGEDVGHHEISYLMCQKWFKEDPILRPMKRSEKIELLYSIRYHSNDYADKYFIAIILRDADKIDTFGKIGIIRTKELYKNDIDKMEKDLRLRYQLLYFIRTKSAKRMIKEKKLYEPIDDFVKKHNLKKIKPIKS